MHDIIIIGAGHNGITAGIYLAKAGLKTLILERNARPGGAMQSAEITRPGFIHDLYSANQNLFLNAQVYQDFKDELESYGLTYCISDKPFANVFSDRQSLRVYQDAEKTRHELSAHNQADADGWQTLYEEFKKFEQHLLPLLSAPMPSWQAGGLIAQAAVALGVKPALRLAKIVLSSTRELGDTYLSSPEAKALVASWGMHLDFGPNVSGGAMFPFVEAFSNPRKCRRPSGSRFKSTPTARPP